MILNKIDPLDASCINNDDRKRHQRGLFAKVINCCTTSPLFHGLLISILITGTILAIIITLWLKTPISKITTMTTSTTPTLRWSTEGITIAGVAGINGTTSDKLCHPFDLAFDWAGNLYVSDRSNHRVQKFSRGSSIGSTVAGSQNGTSGADLSHFNEPVGIQVDDDGNLYVADHYNSRVLLWRPGSLNGSIIAGNGTNGNEDNLFNRPQGIERDSNSGAIYITDPYNNRIMRYASKATSGTRVAGISIAGLSNTTLYCPWSCYLDSNTNSLVIANGYGRNVVRWTLGNSYWTPIAGQLGVQSNTSTTFREPVDVTLDPMGNVYVADFRNHRIQFFSFNQQNGTTVAGVVGRSGTNASLLYMPSSIVLDNQLNLYVADWFNHRIQKFIRY